MKIFQTPESRFINLKDYPFNPHYINMDGLRMHYLDEGATGARPVLLLHGVPDWSYLFRHLIQSIADAGYRVIVPDLIGFGKSDKPAKISDHSYRSHIEWICRFIESLDLNEIVLFGHDWGSLIGLRIVAEQPGRFSSIIISNGMLPTGEQKMHFTFTLWKIFARYSPWLPVDLIIRKGMTGKPDREERRAYRAPFPSSKFKAGIRALPGLVPVSPADPESGSNRIAWETLSKWDKPFLTLFGNFDPITRGGDDYLQEKIPGASGQAHTRLAGGHFLPEDINAGLADNIIKFINNKATTSLTDCSDDDLENPV